MKKITINKLVNMQLLTEELHAAFPDWKRTVTDLEGKAHVVARAMVTDGEIYFPDDDDDAAVQAVIDAHDPGGLSVNDQESVKEQAAGSEFDGMPDWLKNATYEGVEQAIKDRTVGSVTKQQALAAVENAASLADVKVILKNLVEAVYGLVEVNQKIARVVLATVFFIKRRLR